ncbi:hypothetical protein [Chondromyces crocatus]|nr:hypothetical protein [Chondromyces crocatus]
MRHLDLSALEAAERFVWLSGRVLERLRFAHLFRHGDAARVLSALRPYQNPDGGFGEAIEPDFRGPVSQPLSVDFALHIVDEVGGFEDPMVGAALGYLASITCEDGGVPNVLPDVPRYPHAFWWAPAPGPLVGSLLPTASIAGLLHKHRVAHPWLERATSFCWEAIEGLPARVAVAEGRIPRLQIAYETRAALVFLEHAPERARAAQTARALGELLLGRGGFIAAGEGTAGEMSLLDVVSRPGSPARAWFSDAQVEQHLDALLAEQGKEGGWSVSWPAWTAAAGLEWMPIQTVERLKTLKAYGRLTLPAAGG